MESLLVSTGVVALAEIGDVRAVPALIKMLGGEPRSVPAATPWPT